MIIWNVVNTALNIVLVINNFQLDAGFITLISFLGIFTTLTYIYAYLAANADPTDRSIYYQRYYEDD